MDYPIIGDKNERPLSSLVPGGGFSSILRTIGCIGDSLASGEFQTKKEDGSYNYFDKYEYSWGQFIARTTGAKVYNFSKGGMTSRYFIGGFGDMCGCFDSDKRCQAYIMALGHNDLINAKDPLGSVDTVDIDNPGKNPETFIGFYADIVARLRSLRPNPYFFFMTMPKAKGSDWARECREKHAEIINEFAKIVPNGFVLDFHKYAPSFDGEFNEHYYLNGHMNPCGYKLAADMVMSYIDYIIRQDPTRFELIGL